MEKGDWHSAEIQNATIEHGDHPVRRFLHKHLPTIVDAPPERSPHDRQPGDYIRLPSGKRKRISAIIRSAEGVRFYGSDIPLPTEPSETEEELR